MTPLHFAASMDRRDVAELLLRRGAPTDARDGLRHGTPLDWARGYGASDPALLALLSP